jgi:drug/metabolite transporter (DMT)-like permease
MLTFTMPFWVLLIAWPALGERVRGWQWLAIIMALTGLLLIMQPWNLHASLIGKVYAVLGGICWAIAVICAKYLHSRERVDVVNFTFWQTAIATIPIMLAAIIFDTIAIDWNPTFVVCILVVGVGATGLGWVMWLYVLQRLPAGTTSLASLGVPVVAGISSWLQLGERPSPLEFIGMMLIAVALALIAWLNIRQHQPSEPLVQE